MPMDQCSYEGLTVNSFIHELIPTLS